MNGVTVLGKKEQRNVKGGMQMCIFKLTSKTGEVQVLEGYVNTHGAGGSAEANKICVDLVIGQNDTKGCGYDCEHDGFGQ